jgi:hypothetical protein
MLYDSGLVDLIRFLVIPFALFLTPLIIIKIVAVIALFKEYTAPVEKPAVEGEAPAPGH